MSGIEIGLFVFLGIIIWILWLILVEIGNVYTSTKRQLEYICSNFNSDNLREQLKQMEMSLSNNNRDSQITLELGRIYSSISEIELILRRNDKFNDPY